MTEVASKLDKTFREAEEHGTWAAYAVWCLGDADTGDDALDQYLTDLYRANEQVHKRANQLALRYEIEFFNGM